MTPTVLHAEMLDALSWMQDDTFHACITDPPYHLSTVKRFGGADAAPAQYGKDGLYARASAGFMGKKWDGGDIAFQPETWAEVLRVLKPGGYLLCFGGTRTFHRMAVAIEDAGFEIRDCLLWLYGKGFPKSHDAARAVDKTLGVKGGAGEPRSAAHAGWIERGALRGEDGNEGWQRPWMNDPGAVDAAARQYIPGSPEAAAWSGWGTALKPAWEPIIMARKPLVGTVAQNLLAHGAGAINVDACRIGESGRWPANVAHDGSEEVEAAFGNGAQRFFYCGKATAADRAGSKHPTVKPVSLMRWLVRMVTPPGGRILDPFAGSGTTGAAAQAEGFASTLIDAEPEYIADMQRRFGLLEDVFA